jgi:hypothetical protein
VVSRARAGQKCGHGMHDAWVLYGHGMVYAGTERTDVAKRKYPGQLSHKSKLVLDKDVESSRVGVL